MGEIFSKLFINVCVGAMSPAPALPVVRSFRETYPKPPKAVVHTSAPRLHTPGISLGR